MPLQLRRRWRSLVRLITGEDIFISYARADGARYAVTLAEKLEKRGFTYYESGGTAVNTVALGDVLRDGERAEAKVLGNAPPEFRQFFFARDGSAVVGALGGSLFDIYGKTPSALILSTSGAPSELYEQIQPFDVSATWIAGAVPQPDGWKVKLAVIRRATKARRVIGLDVNQAKIIGDRALVPAWDGSTTRVFSIDLSSGAIERVKFAEFTGELVVNLDVSADGKSAVIMRWRSGSSRTVMSLLPETQDYPWQKTISEAQTFYNGAMISRDGSAIFVFTDGSVDALDAATGRDLAHIDAAGRFAASANGAFVVTGKGQRVEVLRTRSEEAKRQENLARTESGFPNFPQITQSARGSYEATISSRDVTITSRSGGKTLYRTEHELPSVAFAPDETLAAVGYENEIVLVDLRTGAAAAPILLHDNRPVVMAFTSDSRTFFAATPGPLAPRTPSPYHLQARAVHVFDRMGKRITHLLSPWPIKDAQWIDEMSLRVVDDTNTAHTLTWNTRTLVDQGCASFLREPLPLSADVLAQLPEQLVAHPPCGSL